MVSSQRKNVPAACRCSTFPLCAAALRRVYLNMEKKIMVLRKNACPDCSFCQCCSETRCSMCLPKPGEKKKEKKPKDKIHKPLFRPY